MAADKHHNTKLFSMLKLGKENFKHKWLTKQWTQREKKMEEKKNQLLF